jgi:hypothetical protein
VGAPEEDGFGDFDEAATTAPASLEGGAPVEDEFGDFGDAVSSAAVAQALAEDEDETFGDFGEVDKESAAEKTSEDGVGSFGEAQAPRSAVPATPELEDDAGFGDFGGAEAAFDAPAAVGDKDGFGGFGKPESAPAPAITDSLAASTADAPARWGEVDNRPTSAFFSPAALHIAQRASAVLACSGDCAPATDDDGDSTGMLGYDWGVRTHERRMAALATTHAQMVRNMALRLVP